MARDLRLRGVSQLIAVVVVLAVTVAVGVALAAYATGWLAAGRKPLLQPLPGARMITWQSGGLTILYLQVENRGFADFKGIVRVRVPGVGDAAKIVYIPAGSTVSLTFTLPGRCSVAERYRVTLYYDGYATVTYAACTVGRGVQVYLYNCTCLSEVAAAVPPPPVPPIPGLPVPPSPAPTSSSSVPYCYPSGNCPAAVGSFYVALNRSVAYVDGYTQTSLPVSVASNLPIECLPTATVCPTGVYVTDPAILYAVSSWSTAAGSCDYVACTVKIVSVAPPVLLNYTVVYLS